MASNYLSVSEAERLTGLPSGILKALAGELPFEYRGADMSLLEADSIVSGRAR
jgi:hypothetical protein